MSRSEFPFGRRFHGRDFAAGEEPGFGRGFGRHRYGHLFAHGNLHLVVLHLIAEKPRHGYEIIKVIEEMMGGAYSPSPGTVYPALSMLDDEGYVTVATGENGKKLYTVTAEGTAYLEANKAVVTAMLARMKDAGARLGGIPPLPVVRAVENLWLALRMRLTQKPLDKEQIQAIADALDRAAKDIERS